MEKNTKQAILEASLDLFSVQGFEATSMAQIAAAVGIRKASLYSHFQSKQEILDTLVQEILNQYEAHSIFARADQQILTPDSAAQMIQEQLHYLLHDPHISKARKMLVIEQFQNPQLAALQTKQNYTDVLRYFTGLMQRLIEQGVVEKDDPQIMAAQLCLPVSVWLGLCDREPEREKEVIELLERHIQQFFKVYQPCRK